MLVHDGIGQALTALKMEICWLEKKLLDVDEPIKKTIQYLNTMVDDTLQRVKWLTAELRPHMLDEIGLADAVEWLTSEFQNITGISCSISVDHEINDLSKDHSSMIFRVVQEALRNVFHHAEATKVLICLKRMNSSIYLKIKDNGKGMSKDKTFSPGSFGLIGMREYITGCGGLLKINSILKRGTTISARIPLKKEAIYGNKGIYRRYRRSWKR